MKTSITTLNHLLAFQLEGMYEIVKDLQHSVQIAIKSTVKPASKNLLRSYAENLAEQRLKLKRIFGYILQEPYGRKSGLITNAILPLKDIVEKCEEGSLRDILFLTSMQSATKFMITSYIDARYIAMRLELDMVVKLLDDILTAEESSLQKLRGHAVQEINDACVHTPVN